MKNRLARVAAAVAIVATVAVAATRFAGPRSGGPLSGQNGAGVTWPARVGDRFTWAMPLPDNHTDSDIVLESVTPDGVTGLDIVGVSVSRAGCQIPTISLGFPAPDVPTQDVPGSTIPAGSSPCALQILVGVVRRDEILPRITSMRVRYGHAGISYEVTIPWSLEVPIRTLDSSPSA